MYFGDLSDESFKLLIVLDPLFHLRFELAGDVEADGFARFFPGDEEDGMFGAIVVAGTVFFAALSARGNERSFDPGVEVLQLAEEVLAFGLEL